MIKKCYTCNSRIFVSGGKLKAAQFSNVIVYFCSDGCRDKTTRKIIAEMRQQNIKISDPKSCSVCPAREFAMNGRYKFIRACQKCKKIVCSEKCEQRHVCAC